MAEDLSTLRAVRAELAATLQRLDDRIAEAEVAQRLTPDDVRMRKLENARRDGAIWATVEDYDTPDADADLTQVFRDRYDGDRQLVHEAMSGARSVWARSRPADGRGRTQTG
jgi:hypothetical protein